MALIRWEPVRELNTIQSEMNRLFNTFFDAPPSGGNGNSDHMLEDDGSPNTAHSLNPVPLIVTVPGL